MKVNLSKKTEWFYNWYSLDVGSDVKGSFECHSLKLTKIQQLGERVDGFVWISDMHSALEIFLSSVIFPHPKGLLPLKCTFEKVADSRK